MGVNNYFNFVIPYHIRTNILTYQYTMYGTTKYVYTIYFQRSAENKELKIWICHIIRNEWLITEIIYVWVWRLTWWIWIWMKALHALYLQNTECQEIKSIILFKIIINSRIVLFFSNSYSYIDEPLESENRNITNN